LFRSSNPVRTLFDDKHPPVDPACPAQLAEASNATAALAAGADGANENTAVGVDGGGRMTPGGTSRIVTPSGFAASKLVPVGVATISTQLPGKPLHVPKMPAVGAGGAVYTTVATPLELVTNVRADSVPKSCPTPFTNMSRRTGCPDFGLPSG